MGIFLFDGRAFMPVSCLFRNMVSCRFHASFMGHETTPVSWAWNHGFRSGAGFMPGSMLGFMPRVAKLTVTS